jgi:hypothetical protein
MLAVTPGVVGVGTVRNMDVPVELEVLNSHPDDNFEAWNHVTEASINVLQGKL